MRLLVTCGIIQAWLALIAAAATPSFYAQFAPYSETDPSYRQPVVYTATGYYPPSAFPQYNQDYAPSLREPVYPEDYYGEPDEYEYPQEDLESSYIQPPRYDSYAPSYTSHPEYRPEGTIAADRVITPVHHSLSPNVITEESWEGRLPNPLSTSRAYAPSFSSHPKSPPYYNHSPKYPLGTSQNTTSTLNIIGGEGFPISPASLNYPELVPPLSPIAPVYPTSVPDFTSPTPISTPETVSSFPFPASHGYPVDGFSRPPPYRTPIRYPSHPNVIYEAPGHDHPKRR